MWIGIDDTDSSQGMCTTFLVPEIISSLNYDLIGYPRLVRLNPNIPWKTRGNAAIAFKIGVGKGKSKKIGEFRGRDILSFQYGEEIPTTDILDKIKKIVERYAILDDKKTAPGIVISKKKISESIYWKAVRSVVSLDFVMPYLKGLDFYGYKSKRGLIGAAAAIAWKPRIKTYELIAYLPEEKWLQERYVDVNSVIEMDSTVKTTFENYDYRNRHVAIKPETKTPVLFGIRGTDPDDLERARNIVKSDPYLGYIIFETNQGTDDHLVRKNISEIKPYDSVIVKGTVKTRPKTIIGGHLIFKIFDETGSIECAAYEKTKEFREIIKKLMPGDAVIVYGSIKKYPNTINIEKIKIESLADIYKKEIPRCPVCGKKMESAGKGKGYRCRKCGTFKSEPNYVKIERDISPGFYQVPIIARRHLSKPIEFFQVEYIQSSHLHF
ncbi:MAG: DUF1743 domain-containing protein [Euryarchaeota archaeon]|nr:DUF1743 domain-containing protein [Euryarchaeota archaeon]